MNTFTKVGNEWCVRLPHSSVPFRSGQTVPVTLRNGSTKQVVLGAFFVMGGDHQIWHIAPAPAAPTEVVGDLSRIIAMFDTSRSHLRAPAITLDGFRVSVAGQRAREPGSLTVTGVERNARSRFGNGMTRQFFGRVTRAGVWEPSRGAPEGLGAKLRAFAADPAGEAAAYGRLHGRCCFCNHRLGEGADRRSVDVGYGPDCAEHFGLAWGTRAAAAATLARPPIAPTAPPAAPTSADHDGTDDYERINRRDAANRARAIASENAMEGVS
jgi:hypothetical protein